SPHYNFGL
uniref:Cydiastatin-1 n=1 Tax=Cydia pomonella TaxID=82600 RepID=ALL1_CYDPO|nr:RecName: Full=Cydiastatin-1 [Cydia pomonella]